MSGVVADPGFADLNRALSRALSGEATTAVVTGVAGVGKTALADAFADHARTRHGARVVFGHCWERLVSVAYLPWTEVFRALDLTNPIAVLEVVAEGRSRRTLHDKMLEQLRAAAGVQPLVIVLENVHNADEASLALLEDTASLGRARVLVVATQRAAPNGNNVVGDRVGARTVDITVDPWDIDAIKRYALATAGASLAPRVAEAVFALSGGVALHVAELVRALRESDRLEDDDPVAVEALGLSRGLFATVRRRVEDQPPQVRELVTAASVAASIESTIPFEVLRQLTGAPPAALLETLDCAAKSGLVLPSNQAATRVRFGHSVIQAAVYESLPLPRRLALHHRVASILEAVGASDQDRHNAHIAQHLLLAGPTADPVKAATRALDAARAAIRVLAHETAAGLAEQALDILQLDASAIGLRCDAELVLAEAYLQSGDASRRRAAGSEAARLARELDDAERFGAAAIVHAGPWAPLGTVDRENVELLEEAAVRIERGPVRTAVLSRLAAELISDPDRAEKAAVVAMEAAELEGEPFSLALASVVQYGTAFRRPPSERLEMAQAVIDVGQRAGSDLIANIGRIGKARDLLQVGDRAGAQHELSLARAGETIGFVQWRLELAEAGFAQLDGDLERAERLATQALTTGQRIGDAGAFQAYAAQLLVLRWEQGRIAELEPAIRTFVAQLPQMPVWRSVLAFVAAETGDLDTARRILRDLAEERFDPLFAHLFWLPGLAVSALAVERLGDASLAGVLLDLLAPHAGHWVVIGYATAHIGPLDGYLGVMHSVAGDHAEARRCFDRARLLCDHMGAPRWADHVEARRAASRAPAPPVVPGSLAGRLERQGEIWLMEFGGRDVRIRHSKGLSYLAYLLSRPRTLISAEELASIDAGRERTVQSGLGPVIDDRARRAYAQRLREIDEELEAAADDLGRRGRVEAERDALLDELRRVSGLGGRTRTAGSSAERARSSVTKLLKGAVEKLREVHPAAGRHLALTVRTGTWCSYDPDRDEEVAWTISSA